MVMCEICNTFLISQKKSTALHLAARSGSAVCLDKLLLMDEVEKMQEDEVSTSNIKTFMVLNLHGLECVTCFM